MDDAQPGKAFFETRLRFCAPQAETEGGKHEFSPLMQRISLFL